jgi:hypothetical protein
MSNVMDISWQVFALWKRLLSFFKTTWKLEDYPIRCSYTPLPEPPPGRLQPLSWRATIVNWIGVFGNGVTKAEALDSLRDSFDRFKQRTPKLPRPGSKFATKIEFANADRIATHPELAKEFIQNVLQLPWAFMSNGSSLYDFHDEETNQKYHERIREFYGVDVSDIESGNLADILDRISSLNTKKPVN